MIVIVPSCAFAGPPEIGVSRIVTPARMQRAGSARTYSGSSVEATMTMRPATPAATMPSSPNRTSSTCAASTTTTITIARRARDLGRRRRDRRARGPRALVGLGPDVACDDAHAGAHERGDDAEPHRPGADDADRRGHFAAPGTISGAQFSSVQPLPSRMYTRRPGLEIGPPPPRISIRPLV